MATFTAASAPSPVRFDLFNVADLVAGTAQQTTPTDFIIGPSMASGTIFTGSGFTYAANTFNAGTINRIERYDGGSSLFVIEGIGLPVVQFNSFVAAGNSQGFLAVVFAGADTLTGSQLDDYLQGFAGNDSILGDSAAGGGSDTLDGGLGADTMAGGDGNDFYFVDNAKDVIQGEPLTGGLDSVQSAVSYVLAANLEHLFLTGAAALNGTGNDLANQILGNAGNNILQGLGANDSIEGGIGNDKLDGGTGNDVMSGGAGNDVYTVDSTQDQVIESIEGKAGGVDSVFTSADFNLGFNIENLTLTGSADIVADGNTLNNLIVAKNDGTNTTAMFGEFGNDTIVGSADSNILDGGEGADKLTGGGGDDFYSVDNKADTVTETLAGLTGGKDTVTYFGSTGYTLGANVEGLNIGFSIGDTFGIGNDLDNTIRGSAGANTLDGRAGMDTLRGGDGDDILVVDNQFDQIDDNDGITSGGIDTVRSSVDFNLTANGTTVLGDFENLTLLGKAAIGTGNNLNNQIAGNAGNNSLSGLDGGDTLDGGAGNDTLAGGGGNDVYVIDSKFDFVNETGADTADQINSSKISVDISAVALANIENIALTGTLALSATGDNGDNVITGNSGANKLFGLGGVDTLIGGDGNDTLDGGIGSDSLIGGAGNDVYFVDGTLPGLFETIDESGGGVDTIITSAAFFNLGTSVSGNVENLILAADAGDIDVVGSTFGDKITGNDRKNLIEADQGNDTVVAGAGDDTLDGNVDFDSLDGGLGNDSIEGGLHNDTLIGGLGDDTLAGEAGDDVVNVAAGNDVAAIRSVLDGHDLITGFDGNAAGGQDTLDLTLLFDSLPPLTLEQRAGRVAILDYGATVDIRINADGDLSNGYELTVATIQTTDAIAVGQDVIVG
jgi:Ca2+-binding RTX toxin-like protein